MRHIYKLRHIPTGLFRGPSGFNEKGRVWSNVGHVKNHLRTQRTARLEELEIVEYEVREVRTIPAQEAAQ